MMDERSTKPKPLPYRYPEEVVAEWMRYYQEAKQRWPTVRELAASTGISRSRAGEYRRIYLITRENLRT